MPHRGIRPHSAPRLSMLYSTWSAAQSPPSGSDRTPYMSPASKLPMPHWRIFPSRFNSAMARTVSGIGKLPFQYGR